MLIPSIDLMGGRIVQLVRGETLKLAFDDFEYWIGRFQHYPLVQLIDLDAAMRQGENSELITRIAGRLPCQVGGGISTVEKAAAVLAAGARRVIVGSALFGGATALQTYVQVFDEEGALDRFEAFASENGARFYGIPLNSGTITLERREQPIMAAVAVDDTEVVVFQGGQTLPWSIGEVSA